VLHDLSASPVHTETALDYDLGPLTWVQPEIDQALERGLGSLAAFAADPASTSALAHARNHVHQASGAIQMVGLDAVAAYVEEIERQLARLEAMEPAGVPAAAVVIERACRKLRIFLDELVNGVQPVPLKLYPEFESMQKARGIKAVAPTDLFYPDLGLRAPRSLPRESIAPLRLPSYLVKQRRMYQRGLLEWLRGEAKGGETMRAAVAAIEDATTQPNLRAFWWTTSALLEGIVGGGLEAGFGLKQLAARIDLQIRRVAEGGAKVADRLRREVLYYVALSAPVGPQIQAVQGAFRLSGLIPSADALDADVLHVQPLLREARDQLAGAKDAWLKAAAGRAENLEKLKQTLASVHTKAVDIRHGALMKLTAALVERLEKLPAAGVSEPLAMEYATALQLAESAFENYASLTPDFPRQVSAMLARLDAARAGRSAGAGAPVLDEMSKRAQERVLLGQVGREIRANLRHMEQVLDAFFRDNTKRGELASLARDGQQIRGALQMLGLDDADRLLALCQAQIERYASSDAPVANDDLELLAESLSGLGFFVEAVEQQRPDRDRLIAPLIARRMGEAPAAAAVETDSVENAVAKLRAQLPQLLAEARRAPSDAGVRDVLLRELTGLRDDAELIGDAELAAQADAALKGFRAGGTATLAAAVEMIADTGVAPAPEISEETQRLLATGTSGFDAELLGIYLAEADEVLDTVAEHHRILAHNPGDREALAIVRRQFHTLKGSGRMVGLAELGELAWEVEQVQNRLIEEEWPVSPAAVAMIETAERSFRGWVDELRRSHWIAPDAAVLRDAIDGVLREWPGGAKRQPSASSPTAPAAATPPPLPPAPMPDLPELGRAGDDDAPLVAAEGETSADEAVEEFAPAEERSLPVLKLVADNTILGDPIAAGLLPSIVTVVEPDEVRIGGVTLSTSLWRILCDEAARHVATLQHELSLLQFDPRHTPTPEMVRASHTLCGINRTAGFPPVAATAKALEQVLIALAQGGAPLPSGALPVLARAVAGLTRFIGHVRARTPFGADDLAEADAIERDIDALRRDALGAAAVDAETAAAEAAEAAFRAEELQLAAHPPGAGAEPLVALRLIAPGAPRASDAAPEREPGTTTADPEELRSEYPPAGEPPIDAEPPAPESPVADSPIPASEAVPPGALEAAVPLPEEAAGVPAAFGHDPDTEAAPVDEAPAEVSAATSSPAPDEIELPVVEDPLRDIRDDVEEQVLSIFLEEAAELYPQAGEQVRAWRRSPRDAYGAQQLRRTLHTFKGSARMAGAMRLGELTHLMESRLLLGDAPAPATPELFEALDTDLDHIAFVLDALREGRTNVPLPAFERRAQPVPPGVAQGDAPGEIARPGFVPLVPAHRGADADGSDGAHEDTVDVEASARAMLRVRADIVDRLVNEAGEVSIARARIEGELRALKANLLELTNSVIRLRTQVREIELQAETQIQSRMTAAQTVHHEFDPLELDRFTRFQELTRSLAEGVNDVSTVQQALLRNLDDADAALVAQARLSRDVQQRLFAIRTVPFGSLSERLYRILRATARELDKRANLEIHGAQTELDRSVLEKLGGPLEHLLRNALDHGIESRAARASHGKPETGEISLTVRQLGNEVVISIADDGAGIDFAGVRDRARALGFIAPDAEPGDPALIECLFQPGFTTTSKVTQISGRGIGMDVVRAEIAALGGRVEVRSAIGKGTEFTLYLPLTLAVAQAVLVRAGGRLWALPAPMVEQVQQVRDDALTDLYVCRKVEWQGKTYPFHYLPRLLGDADTTPETLRVNAVLLLRSGQGLAAIHVDEMVGNQEVVVKNIGPQLARVTGVSGATVLGTGEIVLIINPVQLAMRQDVRRVNADASDERVIGDRPALLPRAALRRAAPLIMIVDDSLTVRKITSRMLQREGFDVVSAKDGVDALQVLGEQTPDIILLDIEMPRMDGFEFTRTMKGDGRIAHIPIIMITSRTAEKHRNRAAELGVDLYLGKPYQEDDLLRNLREMLSLPAPA
jgi:chemosensory pili system protein ChpA (sensor histidine kinase/response regulator)